ncbi:MAG: thermonuclease family protein [Anaerolineales bacterium]|nr:MAG: thermonuclease family protein [Anaerolineales bacterium]
MKKVLALTLITMLLAACAPSAPSTDDTAVQTAVAALLTQQAPAPADATEAPADEAPPASNASQLPTAESIPGLPAEASCVPLGTDRSVGTVVEIVSGDAIWVEVNGNRYEIRYIGIDDGDSPQAMEANRAMVENQQVVLVRDESDVDEYGRYLRYVMVGDAFVNLRLLQQRQVGASPESPDTACERLFNSVP